MAEKYLPQAHVATLWTKIKALVAGRDAAITDEVRRYLQEQLALAEAPYAEAGTLIFPMGGAARVEGGTLHIGTTFPTSPAPEASDDGTLRLGGA